MADYAALKTKADDPAYAGMDEGRIADALNTTMIAKTVDIRAGDVRDYALRHGLVFACKMAVTRDVLPMSVRAAADSFVSICDPSATAEMIPMADEAKGDQVRAMLAGLAAAGVISTEAEGDLLRLAIITTTWPFANGFGRDLDYNDVILARAA